MALDTRPVGDSRIGERIAEALTFDDVLIFHDY